MVFKQVLRLRKVKVTRATEYDWETYMASYKNEGRTHYQAPLGTGSTRRYNHSTAQMEDWDPIGKCFKPVVSAVNPVDSEVERLANEEIQARVDAQAPVHTALSLLAMTDEELRQALTEDSASFGGV